jgi:hypothetical protein
MTLDRGSSKHGRHLDDEMAREVENELRGGLAPSRLEEWREPEPAGDDQPELAWAPLGHEGKDTGDDRDPDYRDQRARIASYLPRGIFPADSEKLVATVSEKNAPEDVISMLSRVNGELNSAHELWEAMGLASGPRF